MKHPNESIKVAFLRPEGSNGHVLAGHYFGEKLTIQNGVPCPDNVDVVTAVSDGRAQYGVVPIENTTNGSVVPILDALWLARRDGFAVFPISERTMVISHHLIGTGESAETKVKQVFSHPQALAQCRNYLCSIGNPETVEVASTSQAVELITQKGDPSIVAIGSLAASRRFGGRVISSNIEDVKGNRTRFLILGQKETIPSGYDKTIVMFTTDPEKAGSLVDVLNILRAFKISMDMVDTIPLPTTNGRREYRFYCEFLGHISDEKVAAAIQRMREWSWQFHVIGSFAASDEIIE